MSVLLTAVHLQSWAAGKHGVAFAKGLGGSQAPEWQLLPAEASTITLP